MSRPQTIIGRPSSDRPSANPEKPISVGSPRRTFSEITDGIHRPGNIYVKQTTYSGSQKLFGRQRRSRLPLLALVLAVIALIVAAFFAVNATGACSQRSNGNALGQFAMTMERDVSYTLNATDLLSLSDTDEVKPASLASGDSFTIASDMLARINSALAPIEQTSACGFVFMDTQTGRALVYHAGKTMNCGGAAMAPLAYYALSKAGGDNDLYGSDAFDSLSGALEAALISSNNDAYFAICSTYFTDEYLQWLASHGVTASDSTTTRAVSENADEGEEEYYDDADYDDEGYENADEDETGYDDGESRNTSDYFPKMSPRSLCAIWASIDQYVKAGSEDAQRLTGYFGATEKSYIRNALSSTGATVLDKAGWTTGTDAKSVTDAGIVRIDGRDYLMAVVTEQSEESATTRANVENLARALFDARGMLAPHIVVSS